LLLLDIRDTPKFPGPGYSVTGEVYGPTNRPSKGPPAAAVQENRMPVRRQGVPKILRNTDLRRAPHGA